MFYAGEKKQRWVVYIDSPCRSTAQLDRFLKILENYTPWVEYRRGCSAYLEFERSRTEEGHPLDLVVRLRKDLSVLGIPFSFGLGSTKLLARGSVNLINSGDILWILPQGEKDLIDGMSVELWPGLYPKTIFQLIRLGIRKMGDLGRIDTFWVKRVWGERGLVMREQACGHDPRPVLRRVPRPKAPLLLPQPRLFPPQGKSEKLSALSYLAESIRRRYGRKAARLSGSGS